MIQLGVQALLERPPAELAGARAGLVAHPASVALAGGELRHSVALLRAHPGLKLVRLFGPEHGLYGAAQEGEKVGDGLDARTGLPVVSLYGERRAPAPEHLHDLDALLFDLQDVGVRCFTYLSTLKACLQACAAAGVRLAVLERPNPLGRAVHGPGVEQGFESFVSAHDVPFVHGRTLAELASLMAGDLGLEPPLVLPLAGWQGEPWAATGLPWTPPSPNLPTLQSAQLYPATVFAEGTNLSEGRGTDAPFRQLGAPWLDGEALAAALDTAGLPGLRAQPAHFTPARSKHAGVAVSGVRLEPTGMPFDPLHAAKILLAEARRQNPAAFAWLRGRDGRFFADLLYGSSALRKAVTAGAPASSA